MKILFTNAYVLTLDEKDFENAFVAVQDNKIVFVGQNLPENFKADRVINAKNKVLMPGFVNAHAHTPMTTYKNFDDNKVLSDWLNDYIWPLEQNLTEEIVYNSTMLGICEYLKGGITSFSDMYPYYNGIIKAVKNTGIRLNLGIGLHPVGKMQTLQQLENFYLQNKNTSNLINFTLYAHSVYANSQADIEKLVTLSKKLNLPLHTHMSETLKEVGDCTAKNNGLTPTGLLEELGFFDRPCSVAHSVYVDKQDIDILKKYGVNVVSCPASNLKLGSGVAPLYALNKAGVNVCLGTDGSASNNKLDMFREMYLASVLQKEQLKDASVMPANEILKMATVNGAKSLGVKKLGKIKQGFLADIIMLDLESINLTPNNNIKNSIVYSGGVENVVLTMVNGKILYENGKFFIKENIEEIKNKAVLSFKKLKEGI